MMALLSRHTSMDKTASQLQSRLLAFITHGHGEFDALAAEVFAFQFERNPVYRAFCERQSVTPATLTDWRQIPAVPTSAFKELPLACFPIAEAVAEFYTSGTTQEKAGKHYFQTLDLYHAAMLPSFREHLLSGAPHRLPMYALTPSPVEEPHSSLAHMLGVVMRELGGDDSEFFVEAGHLQIERLVHVLCAAQWEHQPVCLLGTAFAFVHLLDHCAKAQLRLDLPAGSRLMETGGYKGRSREVPKDELYSLITKHLGVPGELIVNEYGMTELSTQFYSRLGEVKTVPAWVRVLIVDPRSGKEAANQSVGMIRILDLANLWSLSAIQTEDLGIATPAGFDIVGRATDAEARGCSLRAEDFR